MLRQLGAQFCDEYAEQVTLGKRWFQITFNFSNRNRPYLQWERGWYVALNWGNRLSDPVWTIYCEYGKAP